MCERGYKFESKQETVNMNSDFLSKALGLFSDDWLED